MEVSRTNFVKNYQPGAQDRVELKNDRPGDQQLRSLRGTNAASLKHRMEYRLQDQIANG